MKLLVLAQTPPPSHGQSLAVQALLQHLRSFPAHEVHHVNLSLSRESADIGRWRPGKIFAVFATCARVWVLFLRKGRMPIYYVPAPGKRSALYRDWVVMLLCRPWSRGLVLHWHAVGLGAWLETNAVGWERALTRLFLGRAQLAIVPADAVRADASMLEPLNCVTIPNGTLPAANGVPREKLSSGALEVLFVGLGCAEKGLFDAMEGVRRANFDGLPCRLTAVGPFADAASQEMFTRNPVAQAGQARHLGFVSLVELDRLFTSADVLCFPSYYPHEGQPAVLLEALAHDLPIVTTRWRGIPENLPDRHVHLVMPRDPAAIATALAVVRREGPPRGLLSDHHRRCFTKDLHHRRVLAALQTITVENSPEVSRPT